MRLKAQLAKTLISRLLDALRYGIQLVRTPYSIPIDWYIKHNPGPYSFAAISFSPDLPPKSQLGETVCSRRSTSGRVSYTICTVRFL